VAQPAAWLRPVRSDPRAAGLAAQHVWTAYPDYLPYFNEAVPHPQRRVGPTRIWTGPGPAPPGAARCAAAIPQLSLAYRGTADLTREPLPPFVSLAARRPTTGWAAILRARAPRDSADYAWLDAYRPVERIGKSIDLYYIP